MFVKKGKDKRGQVTIFIIVGIIVVVAAVLIYTFYPKIKTTLGIEESNPQSYIQSCVEDKLKETIELVSLQGGSVNPENYLLYLNNKLDYLCYTGEYYIPCIVQEPMLKQNIELEILKEIKPTVDDCFDSLEKSYVGKGYDVKIKEGEKNVELLPKKIVTTFNKEVTFTKGTDVQEYDEFVISVENNLYELIAIANNIIEWESIFGDVDVTNYMAYYPNLKVEKILRGSEGEIYIITDRTNGDKFQFAVRGIVWPAGYVNPIIE